MDFIHLFIMRRIWISSKGKGKVEKRRDICYAAHVDRCIYQYYSHLLNELYNQRTDEDGITEVAVAYRTNLGKSNIQFAKAAYDFIRESKDCYVMIGDFTHFLIIFVMRI